MEPGAVVGLSILAWIVGGLFVMLSQLDRPTSLDMRHIVAWPLFIPHFLVWFIRHWLVDLWRVLKGDNYGR